MKKIYKIITLSLTILFTSLSLIQPVQVGYNLEEAKAFNLVTYIPCNWWGDNGKKIANVVFTDYWRYVMYSKSSTNESDHASTNWLNQLLKFSGYEIGSKSASDPFTKFGLAGLKFTSYTGEWKYYKVDPCSDDENQTPTSTNFGQFYEDRKDPLTTYSERHATTDIRTIEFNVDAAFFRTSAIHKAIWDNVSNIFLTLSKIIVAILLSLVSIAMSDLANTLGIGKEVQINMVSRLYKGLFLPFLTIAWTASGVYILYFGIIKRQYRQSLIGGIVKPLLATILGIVVGVRPELAQLPSRLSVMVQAVVVGAMTEHIAGDGSTSLCEVSRSKTVEATKKNRKTGVTDTVKGVDEDQAELDNQSDLMKQAIGCRIWAEYIFKPFVIGQFGTAYDKLEKLDNKNAEWVKEPEVKLGKKTIKNWGLLQVSSMSGNHTPIDGLFTANVNGVSKDWYRIVDALSNYDDEVEGKIEGGAGGSGGGAGGGGGDSSGANGDWTQKGTKAYEIAETTFKILTEKYGLSGKAAAGILGNIQAESDFNTSLVEAENGQNYSERGYGLFQFTPGTKYLNSPYYKKNASLKQEIENQIDFVMASEFQNGEYRKYLSNMQSWFGMQAGGIEALFDSPTEVDSMLAFFSVYERGAVGPTMHRGRREEAARLANKTFNSKNIKADKSKWPNDKGGGGAGGGGSSSGSSSTSSDGNSRLIFKQKYYPPLKEWDYWVGNHQGHRLGYSLILIFMTILGSIGPLAFALLTSVYSLGLTILCMLAPAFLIFGAWGGKGNNILMQYLGSIVATFMKKIVCSVLLVLSIIISTATIQMLNEVGFMKALLFMTICTFALYKNRNKIMEKAAQINLPQLNTASAAEVGKKAVQAGTGAVKYTGKISASAVSGGIGAKKNKGSFKSGAKAAVKNTLKNDLLRSKYGRLGDRTVKAMQAKEREKLHREHLDNEWKRATGRDDEIENGSGINENNIPPQEKHICMTCGTEIGPGEQYYMDEFGNTYCSVCATLQDNFTDFDGFVHQESDNYVPNEKHKMTGKEGKVITYKNQDGEYTTQKVTHLDQKDITYSMDLPGDFKGNREAIIQRIKESLALVQNDINNAKEEDIPLSEAFIPNTLYGFVNPADLQNAIISKNHDLYKSIMTEGWRKWYTTQAQRYGKLSNEDLNRDLDEIGEDILKQENKSE